MEDPRCWQRVPPVRQARVSRRPLAPVALLAQRVALLRALQRFPFCRKRSASPWHRQARQGAGRERFESDDDVLSQKSPLAFWLCGVARTPDSFEAGLEPGCRSNRTCTFMLTRFWGWRVSADAALMLPKTSHDPGKLPRKPGSMCANLFQWRLIFWSRLSHVTTDTRYLFFCPCPIPETPLNFPVAACLRGPSPWPRLG
jgi:hypothetical protein